ncbi:hypothetical protein D3C76_1704170 [compost metagenome]
MLLSELNILIGCLELINTFGRRHVLRFHLIGCGQAVKVFCEQLSICAFQLPAIHRCTNGEIILIQVFQRQNLFFYLQLLGQSKRYIVHIER